jgi:Flp pilus assembly protein TadG
MTQMHNGRRQSGQVIVLFAIALIAMLAMVGVAVDGGTLYVQRRTAQNSADAGALAGTRALQQSLVAANTTIGSEICKYVLANSFGVTPTPSAYFVNTSGTSLGTVSLPTNCSGASVNVIPSGSSGIHVAVTIGPYNTYLAGLVGVRQLEAQASATAQVGVLSIPLPDLTPLAGCGPDMLTNGQSALPFDDILNADNSINTSFYGQDMILQGSQMSQNEGATCPAWNGISSAWKGKITTSGLTGNVFSPPFSVPVDTGDGTIDSIMDAICANLYPTNPAPTITHSVPPDVCKLLVPIAAPPNPTNDANIVTLGCFSVYTDNQGYEKWRGVLHPPTDCSYGVYVPNWTYGNSTSETQVMLTS